MSEYDNLNELSDYYLIMKEHVRILGTDSLMYIEDNKHVILTKKNGCIRKRYFDKLSYNSDYKYFIGEHEGYSYICNKYGDKLLSYTTEGLVVTIYKDIFIYWDIGINRNSFCTAYKFINQKLKKLYEELNGMIQIIPDIELLVDSNNITHWNKLIDFEGNILLDDKSILKIYEDAFIISSDETEKYLALYRYDCKDKKIQLLIDYTNDFEITNISFEITKVIFRDNKGIIFESILKRQKLM